MTLTDITRSTTTVSSGPVWERANVTSSVRVKRGSGTSARQTPV